MLHIAFTEETCRNSEEALQREWLETNDLGSYASSSLSLCNTRKYHGLLVANLAQPEGRYVLLSTLEETLRNGGHEHAISCRKHPYVFYPRGDEALCTMQTTVCPSFSYTFNELTIRREIMMVHKRTITLIRYSLECACDPAPTAPLILSIKPLLAFRHFHALTFANDTAKTATRPVQNGVTVQPYASLPQLALQFSTKSLFNAAPDWVRAVEYLVEEERGFPFNEDLLSPGTFDIPLSCASSVILAASTEPLDLAAESLENLWHNEWERRETREKHCRKATGGGSPLLAHLAERAADFLITTPHESPALLAGYHWFDAWGRDTCISLAGLSLASGAVDEGIRELVAIGKSAKKGLIPNCFSPDGVNHAYNSVDASLWYVWTVQHFDAAGVCPDVIKNECWPAIKNIIDAFMVGPLPSVFVDNAGMLHAGSAQTQLTWMDAMVNGVPVTPRHGCPVEINALWYNALAYASALANRFGEAERNGPELFERMRRTFKDRFWIRRKNGGYLADTWRNGYTDASLRPNQLFAVSLPYPILYAPDLQQHLVAAVKETLLTPYGLRTLASHDPSYRAMYHGSGESRDSAYHQGTVWPWLLGAYGDALFKSSQNTAKDAKELLETITPLFTKHLTEAGLGSISEVFDASSPHRPNGCIAQAWSLAEPLRLLRLVAKTAPEVFHRWEATHFSKSLPTSTKE